MKKSYPSKTAFLRCLVLILLFALFQPIHIKAIETDTLKKVSILEPLEYFEGQYMPVSRDDMEKSPAYRFDGSSYFTVQVNVTDDGENIVGDAANEPSMAIDQLEPDKMVIGWREFTTVTNNFRQAGYAYTTDGGETWTFPGVIDEGIFRSDPVLGSDTEGNIFYNSLTVVGNDYYCDVYKMETGSEEWDAGTYALGGDKQWMAIDNTGGVGNGNNYSNWTAAYSTCYPDFFTRSVDGGESFEDCISIPGRPYWGTLTTGANGTVYVAGFSDEGFIMVKSTNAQNPDSAVTWDPMVDVDMGGVVTARTGPNPDGLIGQTWIDVDRSEGPHGGNVYMLCSVWAYNNDKADVMFARSTDGGETWEDPIRVNDDESVTNWQWFGTMSVAPNGRIDAVWLDTRDGELGQYGSSLYYSYSVDGGETFSVNERISEAFDPHKGWPEQQKMGDYFHMISDNDYAHLAWANTLNGEQDVYYTRINPWFVGVEEGSFENQLTLSIYPNPAKNNIKIRFDAFENGEAVVILLDAFGKEIISQTEKGAMGRNIDINTASLKNGIYFVRVSVGQQSAVAKVVISK